MIRRLKERVIAVNCCVSRFDTVFDVSDHGRSYLTNPADVERDEFEAALIRRGFRLTEYTWRSVDGLVSAVHDCFGIDSQSVLDVAGI